MFNYFNYKYSFITIKELINLNIRYTNKNICSNRLYKLTNSIIFQHKPISPIYIGTLNKKQYLLDGHYRFEIYKYNKTNLLLINNRIPIIDIFPNNMKELDEYYNLINDINSTKLNNTLLLNDLKDSNKAEIAEVTEDIEMEDMEQRELIIKQTYDYFMNNYSNSFKYNGRRRPYLCKYKFLEELEIIYELEKHRINSSKCLINILEKLNNKYKCQKDNWFPAKGDIDNTLILNNIKQNNNLYFGLFPNEWYKHLNKFPTYNSETKISKSLRQQVWFKYANNKLETKCNCCGLNTINAFTFECGHIVPASKGGKCNINNLVPICSLCNKSMGTINMIKFMKHHNYPINHLIK